MDLYLSNKGNMKVSMIKYPEGVIESFLEEIIGNTYSPLAAHLFNVCKE